MFIKPIKKSKNQNLTPFFKSLLIKNHFYSKPEDIKGTVFLL